VIALVAVATVLVGSSGAAVAAASGDTCAASGNGTAYTLIIAIPAKASAQADFAFGATGVTVTNINIAGTTGTLSTQNLPANTSGQWLMSSPPRAGQSLTAVVTTSAPVRGPFTVVAASSRPSGKVFSPFHCALSTASAAPSNAFSVNRHATYSSAAAAWHLTVNVPAAGTVSGIQALPAAAGMGSKAVSPKSEIHSRKVVAKSAGIFTLTLRPTPLGDVALAKSGSLRLTMTVAFSPKGGKTASKVITLLLEK
jgi:hypothetical protein